MVTEIMSEWKHLRRCNTDLKNTTFTIKTMKSVKLHCKVNLAITVGNVNSLSTFTCDQVTTTMHFQTTCCHILILLLTNLEANSLSFPCITSIPSVLVIFGYQGHHARRVYKQNADLQEAKLLYLFGLINMLY
jgi:hypothetical protein